MMDNEAIYTGDWYAGYRDGKGIQEWLDGSKYIGDWSRDKANG